jgi:hypothetical protein
MTSSWTERCGKEVADRDAEKFGQLEKMLGRDANGRAFISLDRVGSNAERAGERVLG